MTKTLIRVLAGMSLAMLAFHADAQGVSLSLEEYNTRKVAGTLPAEFHVEYSTLAVAPVLREGKGKPGHGGQPKGGSNGLCNCWIEPDANYTLAMGPNDDQSSGLVTLPFSFNLYGQNYTNCYINNNGNVSFDAPYFTYSADPFPTAGFVMVAPFWADVDTRGEDGNGLNGGTVKYLITPTALYVNWTSVGYFPSATDKHNTFQLIITDGTDPVIGVGNNVSFCYKEMEWTTGSASGGTNGFGGTPSTTGANQGNGVDFIQFVRCDQPGGAYDGPFGNPDGIDWLDFQNFRFTTAVSTQNIPPITSSNFLCDTVEVCMGELVNFNVTFLTPEGDQAIIDATATAPTIDNFNYTITNNGSNAVINVQFIPQVADTGFHVVTFTAQDNGADSLTSTVSIVLAVYYTPAPPPTIEGSAEACEGVGSVISASPGYEDYYWSNGFNGPTILVGPGTYYCLATSGNCRLASNFITVTEIPNPEPDITGPLFSCGGLPVTLGVDNPYDIYQWSNGSTDPNITVGTGQYVVTVTDTNGCVGTATPVNVLTANDPAAFFVSDEPSTVFPGTTITYTDQSTVQGSTITSYAWAIDGAPAGNGTTLVEPWDTPGTYNVTLTVTSADGCTNTYSYTQIVIPTEIEIPNVFSPNNDNQNDALVFPGVEYYPNTSLRVFNRWGQAIYESTNYKNNWRAPDVAEGTYFFVLKLANGKDYSGHVTLLR